MLKPRKVRGEVGTFRAYPLVESGTPDFEEWASAWCARRGWALVEIVAQRPCSPTHHQLTLRVRKEED